MCAYIDRHPIRIIKIEVQLLTVATAKQQIFICVQLSLIYKDTWDNCNGWVFLFVFFLQAKNKIQSHHAGSKGEMNSFLHFCPVIDSWSLFLLSFINLVVNDNKLYGQKIWLSFCPLIDSWSPFL